MDEWKTIILKNNSDKAKKKFLVMIGLSSNLSDEEKESLVEFNKSQKDILLVTWNYLLDNIIGMREQMNNILR